MEKFKNFVYDKSDLLVALLIIAIAALVIWFGISNIMKPYTHQAEAQSTVSEEPTEEPANTTASAGILTPAATDKSAENDKNAGDITTKAAKIIIQPGENSNQIAEKLIASGAITDKNAFYAKLEELGIASMIQEGTFEIPAGSSLEVVCRIVTKTN